MEKSIDTKVFILDTALKLARTIGFESISIGELAKKVGMSKSGLFAHFKSKETLQVMIMDHAAYTFVKTVIKPAIKKEKGLARLNAIVNNWVKWSFQETDGSCPLISAAIEFDDRPGKVKEQVKKHLSDLHNTLARAYELTVENGELDKNADTQLMAQETFSYILAYHLYKKTLNDNKAKGRFQKSIQLLIERNSTTI
jgi:AcrR family transcriptional regulator